MPTTTYKPIYATSAALTITLASLATSATRVAGVESDTVDNSTNLYDEVLLSGKITTGTSPTVSKQIDVWVVAAMDGSSTWPDVFDGTNSAETWTSENVRNAGGQILLSILVDATSDRTYYFSNRSVAALFGGVVPQKFVVFVAHDTAVNLNATGSNHAITMQGVQWQSV